MRRPKQSPLCLDHGVQWVWATYSKMLSGWIMTYNNEQILCNFFFQFKILNRCIHCSGRNPGALEKVALFRKRCGVLLWQCVFVCSDLWPEGVKNVKKKRC